MVYLDGFRYANFESKMYHSEIVDFLRHAPCMLHVQNKYEECSKHYQDTLTKIPEPLPNATNEALEQVCWYVFQMITDIRAHFIHSKYFEAHLILIHRFSIRFSSFREYISCTEHIG